MLIKGKKFIQSIKGYTGHIKESETFLVGVAIDPADEKRLKELGFSYPPKAGELLLPACFGRFTKRNSIEKEVVLRDQPKETKYRQQEITWQQWVGRGETEEKTGIANIPYKRFPRKYLPSPSLELAIKYKGEHPYVVVDRAFINESGDDEMATLAINILLELFGRAELFTKDLSAFVKPIKVVRLHWEVLPPGQKLPVDDRIKKYESLVAVAKKSKQGVVTDRFRTILEYSPDFEAIGQNGFNGYVIFGFESLGLFIFESAYHGNATYVIEGDWETISKMTKGEIMERALHKHRLIHRDEWKKHIHSLLNSNVKPTRAS
ncbi:hypothetical protein [Brevibacillus sp. MER 51]|uniref:hypothetical protein n=1 Tax=Brevibacillus sp. MER 51 TaxID=2939560 RepID=UPI00203ED82A|nr:hypothetical protein [Brevibacillus sp. MER 51]MCM3143917.1 hypothetical protein [Brevibacillus sp. MER 51]